VWVRTAEWTTLVGTISVFVAVVTHGPVHLVAAVLTYGSLVLVVPAILLTTGWYRRGTGRWPVTLGEIRQRAPIYLREQFRFGHNRWHKPALVIPLSLAAVPRALAWGGSRSGR
jgi:hypothetical protein